MRIITPWEVVKYSPLGDTIPSVKLESIIPRKEGIMRLKVLGGELYNKLIAELEEIAVDYGNLKDWDEDATYAANDRVLYYGAVLKSIQADNTTNPCIDPDDVFWVVEEKFTSPCFKGLWDYLKYYLAYQCASEIIIPATYGLGAHGVTERLVQNGTSRSGSSSQVGVTMRSIRDGAQEYLELLTDYMQNSTTCDFSTSPLVGCKQEDFAATHVGGFIFPKNKKPQGCADDC